MENQAERISLLDEYERMGEPDEEALRAELKEERAKLAGYQTRIKEAGLPGMVFLEGEEVGIGSRFLAMSASLGLALQTTDLVPRGDRLPFVRTSITESTGTCVNP